MEDEPGESLPALARRRFITTLISVGGLAAVGLAFGSSSWFLSTYFANVKEAGAHTLARYPQKTDLILLTDRPPQLETPLDYFQTRSHAERCIFRALASLGDSHDG